MNQNNYKDIFNTEEVDLKMVFYFFWDKKLIISYFTIFAAVISVLYALYLPNIYKSSALLSPSSIEKNLTNKLSAFSSVASFTGINLPSGQATKTQEAVYRINSFDFFNEYFLPNIQLEDLMAIKKWNVNDNIITYDSDFYIQEKNQLVRDVSYPLTARPSAQEAYRKYKNIMNVSIDDETSFVTISIESLSPILAKNWLDIIISGINLSMRNEDTELALNSIEYLKEQAQITNIQSIKESISGLMESQLHTLMLASSSKDYIFTPIESPIVPELKSAPNRAFISIFGTILGFIASLVCLFSMGYIKNETRQS